MEQTNIDFTSKISQIASENLPKKLDSGHHLSSISKSEVNEKNFNRDKGSSVRVLTNLIMNEFTISASLTFVEKTMNWQN